MTTPMTADQLTDKLLELRRKYRVLLEEARSQDARAAAILEELYGLGYRKKDDWRDEKLRAPDRYQQIRAQFRKDTHDLIETFVGIPPRRED
jgi:hypothetical protein